ncbi:MAG: type II toxin-antitoxin system VapC family toxin [Planctomycetes bacterium]|nr:type II toxin-antitoxin system VapC family toxin [Planctomycetota bacterium]
MTYLLDSNVWVALLRGKNRPVASRFRAAWIPNLRVCSVIVAELRYGCARSAKPAANRAAVDALLTPILSLPFDDKAVDEFVGVRTHLESLGKPIGPFDLQIAAIALANNCTLVTHNQAEFSRVPKLLLEDWELP